MSWFAVLAAGGVLAGCGATSGASTLSTTPLPGAAVTRARALAYADAVNLRAGDLPGMTVEGPAGEAPAPNRSAFAFARCYGGVRPDGRTVKVHSQEFAAGRAAQSQLVESRVEVWPTAALATRNNAAYLSPRGHDCFVRTLETSHRQFNSQHPERLQFGPLRVVTVANPLLGVSRSFLRTIDETLLRGGRVRLHIFHDVFTFISGPAEVELEATGFSRPLPSRTEERLLLLLLGRAKQNAL
jgi:hypothetical protein